jgi:hypothetical protein
MDVAAWRREKRAELYAARKVIGVGYASAELETINLSRTTFPWI